MAGTYVDPNAVNHAVGSGQVTVDDVGGNTVTIDELLAIAQGILDQAQTRYEQEGVDPRESNNEATKDADKRIYADLWKDHKVFAEEFPLIFRWIVSTLNYSERALRIYISRDHKKIWKNREEMLDAQINYLVYARRAKNPRESPKSLNAFRTWVTKKVREDNELFESAGKEAEETCKQNSAARIERIKKAIIDQVRGKTAGTSS